MHKPETGKGATRTVSAATANREFSRLLREAQGGSEVVITSRGRPVAVISPFSVEKRLAEEAERERLFQEMIAEWRQRPVLNLPRFNRDELYD